MVHCTLVLPGVNFCAVPSCCGSICLGWVQHMMPVTSNRPYMKVSTCFWLLFLPLKWLGKIRSLQHLLHEHNYFITLHIFRKPHPEDGGRWPPKIFARGAEEQLNVLVHQPQPGYLCWGVHVYFRFPGHKCRYHIMLRVKFNPGIASVKLDRLPLGCWCCMVFNLDHIQSELVLASPKQGRLCKWVFSSPHFMCVLVHLLPSLRNCSL